MCNLAVQLFLKMLQNDRTFDQHFSSFQLQNYDNEKDHPFAKKLILHEKFANKSR